MSGELVIYSKRVLFHDQLIEASVIVKNGKITEVIHGKYEDSGFPFEDFDTDVVMPGLIDSHVHINEPGRTHWEGFETATRAAAAGGITTLIEMPLNSSPVTTTLEAFMTKINVAEGQCHVNCGFYGGIVPGNLGELDKLALTGVFGFKAFLIYSGIDEFQNATFEELENAVPVLLKYNLPLLVHCELYHSHSGEEMLKTKPKSYQAYLASRPKSWENEAIKMVIDVCRKYGVRVHIVHLSSSEALPMIRQARSEGFLLTVETCPHYLYFNAEEIHDGSTIHKCAPPIREKENNELLWQAVLEGDIDFIVTDHSPAPLEIKELQSGNFSKAWGGIAGLQFSLPVFWTCARHRNMGFEKVSNLMSHRIAQFLGMDRKKGKIDAGYDADIMVWDPEQEFIVALDQIQHRHKITPYLGERLFGVIKHTFLGGKMVYSNGTFPNLSNGTILTKRQYV